MARAAIDVLLGSSPQDVAIAASADDLRRLGELINAAAANRAPPASPSWDSGANSDGGESQEQLKQEGSKMVRAGRYDEAVLLYSKALELGENEILLANRSVAHWRMNRFDEALEDAERCVQHDPFFWKGHSRKAVSLSALRRRGEAVAALEAGLRYLPESADLIGSLEKLADDWMKKRWWSDANTAYSELVSRCGAKYKDKHETCCNMLDRGEAEGDEAPQPVPAPAPKPAPAPAPAAVPGGGGNSRPQRGCAPAGPPAGPGVASGPAEAKKDEGNEYLKKGNLAEAIRCYTEGLELDPKSFVIATNRSNAYWRQKQYADALSDAELALSLNRRYWKAWNRKGCALIAQEKFGPAVEALREALLIEPGCKAVRQTLEESIAERCMREKNAGPLILKCAVEALTALSEDAGVNDIERQRVKDKLERAEKQHQQAREAVRYFKELGRQKHRAQQASMAAKHQREDSPPSERSGGSKRPRTANRQPPRNEDDEIEELRRKAMEDLMRGVQ